MAFRLSVIQPFSNNFRRFFMTEQISLSAQLKAMGLSGTKRYPGSNTQLNPVDIFRTHISNELSKISGVPGETIYPALEFTNNADRGDLLIPVPRLRVKGAAPAKLAEEWAAAFPKSELLEKVQANGVFMQFSFSPSILYELVVKKILNETTDYGRSEIGKGKHTLIEFSSPNIAKPFHAGHLRSTIIGGFLANLHELHGYKVTRINYLGDWGKQFGLLAVGFNRFGDETKLEEDPINYLFEIYVKINKIMEEEKAASPDNQSETDDEARDYFRRMEEGDETALALWRKLRDLSIAKYKETYARLNINYDAYSGESQVSQETMVEVLEELKAKGLAIEDKGALLVPLENYQKKLGKAMVQKRDGTTLYLTRDVGEVIRRHDMYQFDKLIYVVSSQQDLHIAQLFKVVELLGFEWASKLQHVNYGLVQGMSTRKGTVVFLDNILDEAKEAMHETMKKNEAKYAQVEDPEYVAGVVGLSAVMIQDMQSKRINSYEFKWDRILTFEGDTGPYLEYAHSRLCSMERKAQIPRPELASANFSLLTEPIASQLVRILASFPDVVHMAYRNYEPSTVITYLFKLTHTVSSCYDVLWVAGQPEEVAKARMALYAAARQVLYNGLVLLGVTPVERM